MSEDTSVLFFHISAKQEPKVSPIEIQLSSRFGTRFFALDNHSDQLSIQYGTRFIEEAEMVLAIIWQEKQGAAKGVQGILNALLKKKNRAVVLTNVEGSLVNKLANILPVEQFKTASELLEKIKGC